MAMNSKILIVDDNADFAEMLRIHLGSHYGEIRCAATLGEAGSLITNWLPDVVLCDYHLPDAKGTDLLKISRTESAPVFFIMTGDKRAESLLNENADIKGLLIKPFSLSELRVTIDAAVKEAK